MSGEMIILAITVLAGVSSAAFAVCMVRRTIWRSGESSWQAQSECVRDLKKAA